MSNMSYVRFQNTLRDLHDCKQALEEEGLDALSEEERRAALELIKVCRKVVEIADD